MTNNSLLSSQIGCFSQNPLKCQNAKNSKNALKMPKMRVLGVPDNPENRAEWG